MGKIKIDYKDRASQDGLRGSNLRGETVRADYKNIDDERAALKRERRIDAVCNVLAGAMLGTAVLFGIHQLREAASEQQRAAVESVESNPARGMSLNWAGYDAISAPGVFGGVSGTFTVPRINDSDSSKEVDMWVGIGGGGRKYNGLIQAGVNVSNGRAVAFDEALPDKVKLIESLKIRPGDTVRVDLHNVSGNAWSVRITDETDKQSFSTEMKDYGLSTYTAECIVERGLDSDYNMVLLPDFNKIDFGACTPELTEKGLQAAEAQAAGRGTFFKAFIVDMANYDKSYVTRTSDLRKNGGFTVQYVKGAKPD